MLFDPFISHSTPYRLGVIKHCIPSRDKYRPFAIDDTIMQAMGRSQFPYDVLLHFWPTEPLVILGMQDTRLPFFADAVAYLNHCGYPVIVRPSGGLAVVSDPGVLNLSLLIHASKEKPEIFKAYSCLTTILSSVFQPYDTTLEVGEVKTSYCPGKYDVSINQQKIAGLSQRRIGNAVGLFMYISLSGSQNDRGTLIREFYRIGLGSETTHIQYPNVHPDTMTTVGKTVPALSDIQTFETDFIRALQHHDHCQPQSFDPSVLDLSKKFEAMAKRNQDIPLFNL